MSNTVYATYLIPESRFEAMEKAVKKLARKVAKGKTAAEFPPVIEATRKVVCVWNGGRCSPFNPNKQYSDNAEFIPYLWVTLKYARPVLNGWHLVAVYDWEVTADGTRTCYASTVPGQMLLPDQHDAEDGRCDHCHTNRRRNKSMLITKDFIDFKVVGSTCIKDFLGHATPNSFIDCYSFEMDIERFNDGSYAGGPSIAIIPTQKILELSAMYIRQGGYVKASEFGMSTADTIRRHLNPLPNDVLDAPNDSDIEVAKLTAKWVMEQPDTNDYMVNLQKAISAGAISGKRIGVVASAVYTYQRHMEHVTAQGSPKVNEHLGNVGERLKTLSATVERVRYSHGYYGLTTIVTLRTPQGHCLVWFASNGPEIERGAQWTLDGTVKKHDDYNGMAQTVLSRVKYKEV